MFKKILSFALALALAMSVAGLVDPVAGQASAATTSYRALCIGNEDYGGGNDLKGPANDAIAMMNVLKKDSNYKNVYGYKNIRSTGNKLTGDALLNTTATFAQLVERAFKKSTASDVNVFYFSGHSSGVDKNGEAALMLIGNGKVTAKQLKAALDTAKGKKVVILDICNAGNLIGKGAETGQEFIDAFTSEVSRDGKAGDLAASGYYVLAASSGTEYSWSVQSPSNALFKESSRVMGVFTSKIAQGMGDKDVNYRIMADANVNGKVTLNELMDYARNNNRWTKAQMYPENSNLTIFQYTVKNSTKPLFTNVSVSPMSGGSSTTYKMTFDLAQKSTITYGIAAFVYDPVKYPNSPIDYAATVDTASLAAGKAKQIKWNSANAASSIPKNSDLYFYLKASDMAVPVAFPFVYNTAKSSIGVKSASSLKVGGGREAAITVTYTSSCTLNVNVYNSSGKKVRNLATNDPTFMYGRTQDEDREKKNMYYWNGKDDSDTSVPAGTYTIKVTGKTGAGATNTVSCKIKIS